MAEPPKRSTIIKGDPTQTDMASIEQRIPQMLDRWGRGETSLRELYGYTDEELYGISTQAFTLLMAGKIERAKTIFEGLVALDPRNDYYYRALGFAYHRLGDGERALRQFGYAIKVQPRDLISYVNRAEILIQQKAWLQAEEELKKAIQIGADQPDHPMVKKATAIMSMLPKTRQRVASR